MLSTTRAETSCSTTILAKMRFLGGDKLGVVVAADEVVTDV